MAARTTPPHRCKTTHTGYKLFSCTTHILEGCPGGTNCGLWLSYWREVIPIFLMAASCSGVKGNTGLEPSLSAVFAENVVLY